MNGLEKDDGVGTHSQEGNKRWQDSLSLLVTTGWFVGMLCAVGYSLYLVGASRASIEVGVTGRSNYVEGAQGASVSAMGTGTAVSRDVSAYNATIESLYAAATSGAVEGLMKTLTATVDVAEAAGTPTPVGLVGCPNVASVNVRSGPGISYRAIGYILDGDCVTVRGRNEKGEWILIYNAPRPSSDGGWVSRSLMTVDGNIMDLDVVLNN